MSLIDEILPLLKKLRLSGILQSLELRTREAVDDNLSHTEFLYRLMSDELERREATQLDQRLRRACFEHSKTLEDFDFQFNASVPKAKVLELGTCAFVERRHNVLLVGQAGVGKSHIAQALGHRACRAGYSVLYVGANDALRQLRAARSDGTYDRKLLRLTTPELLIVDDLGLRALSGDEPADLHEIIRHRYERGSLVITSNRDVDEIARLFGDQLLASAAMDRLLHHAEIIRIDGDSYRNPPTNRCTRAARSVEKEAVR
ncbi:MAG: IS21-like element helper ATPase IstB [Sandaracinaceae bacterium]|nr:IS21-like element helper ATPase IstB [Sandaracinaceae bacterium]